MPTVEFTHGQLLGTAEAVMHRINQLDRRLRDSPQQLSDDDAAAVRAMLATLRDVAHLLERPILQHAYECATKKQTGRE